MYAITEIFYTRYRRIVHSIRFSASTDVLEFDRAFANKYHAGFVTKPLNNSQMKNITALFIEHCTDEVQKHIRKSYN